MLFLIVNIYSYHDGYSLTIVGKHPTYALTRYFLWPFVSVLLLASIKKLVLFPHKYLPVHPEHPTPDLTPEPLVYPKQINLL